MKASTKVSLSSDEKKAYVILLKHAVGKRDGTLEVDDPEALLENVGVFARYARSLVQKKILLHIAGKRWKLREFVKSEGTEGKGMKQQVGHKKPAPAVRKPQRVATVHDPTVPGKYQKDFRKLCQKLISEAEHDSGTSYFIDNPSNTAEWLNLSKEAADLLRQTGAVTMISDTLWKFDSMVFRRAFPGHVDLLVPLGEEEPPEPEGKPEDASPIPEEPGDDIGEEEEPSPETESAPDRGDGGDFENPLLELVVGDIRTEIVEIEERHSPSVVEAPAPIGAPAQESPSEPVQVLQGQSVAPEELNRCAAVILKRLEELEREVMRLRKENAFLRAERGKVPLGEHPDLAHLYTMSQQLQE